MFLLFRSQFYNLSCQLIVKTQEQMIRRVDLRAAQQESKLRQVLEIVGGVSGNDQGSAGSDLSSSDDTAIFSVASRNTSV